eukprot:Gb_01713 [translate_table: standard]
MKKTKNNGDTEDQKNNNTNDNGSEEIFTKEDLEKVVDTEDNTKNEKENDNGSEEISTKEDMEKVPETEDKNNTKKNDSGSVEISGEESMEKVVEDMEKVADTDDEENGKKTDNGSEEIFTKENMGKVVDTLSKEELAEIVKNAIQKHTDLIENVKKIANDEPSHRKIFVRGLSWDTKPETLKKVFAEYGEVEKGEVVTDKNTGKSRGYGFVTFKSIESALRALRVPSKKIDGRMAACQLSSGGQTPIDPQQIAARKIYVSGVPADIKPEKLVNLFSQYGEIEEGPLGFDRETGKSRGFAFFIYKSADSVKRALAEPTKTIDGAKINCKLGEVQKPKNETPSKSSTKTSSSASQEISSALALGGFQMPGSLAVRQGGLGLSSGLGIYGSQQALSMRGLLPQGMLGNYGTQAYQNPFQQSRSQSIAVSAKATFIDQPQNRQAARNLAAEMCKQLVTTPKPNLQNGGLAKDESCKIEMDLQLEFIPLLPWGPYSPLFPVQMSKGQLYLGSSFQRVLNGYSVLSASPLSLLAEWPSFKEIMLVITNLMVVTDLKEDNFPSSLPEWLSHSSICFIGKAAVSLARDFCGSGKHVFSMNSAFVSISVRLSPHRCILWTAWVTWWGLLWIELVNAKRCKPVADPLD